MTFKKIKIKVTDPQHSKEIQEELFKLGYEWFSGERKIRHDDAEVLYADEDGCITYSYLDHFDKVPENEEHFLSPAGLVTKDYYKQPITSWNNMQDAKAGLQEKISIPARYENPQTDEDNIVKQTFDKMIDNVSTPIGLVPKSIHDSNRLRDIVEAMQRFSSANKRIPVEWISELQYLNNLVE
jgi:hypothetical protein